MTIEITIPDWASEARPVRPDRPVRSLCRRCRGRPAQRVRAPRHSPGSCSWSSGRGPRRTCWRRSAGCSSGRPVASPPRQCCRPRCRSRRAAPGRAVGVRARAGRSPCARHLAVDRAARHERRQRPANGPPELPARLTDRARGAAARYWGGWASGPSAARGASATGRPAAARSAAARSARQQAGQRPAWRAERPPGAEPGAGARSRHASRWWPCGTPGSTPRGSCRRREASPGRTRSTR